MKLNFWQWIGLILLIGGLIALVYRETRPKPDPARNPNIGTAPVVQPVK
jgi:hypothetical protein